MCFTFDFFLSLCPRHNDHENKKKSCTRQERSRTELDEFATKFSREITKLKTEKKSSHSSLRPLISRCRKPIFSVFWWAMKHESAAKTKKRDADYDFFDSLHMTQIVNKMP